MSLFNTCATCGHWRLGASDAHDVDICGAAAAYEARLNSGWSSLEIAVDERQESWQVWGVRRLVRAVPELVERGLGTLAARTVEFARADQEWIGDWVVALVEACWELACQGATPTDDLFEAYCVGAIRLARRLHADPVALALARRHDALAVLLRAEVAA